MATTTKKDIIKKENTTAKKVAVKLSAPVYTMDGKESGKIDLPEELFGVSWKAELVHQVVLAMQANARPTVASTKDRSEVRGGGKKPWKQKGTGRARHGSRRSPIWRGGGTTHGPRPERDYTQKANRKMRIGALVSVLSKKFAEGEVFFVDSLSFDAPKSKDAKSAITAIAKASGTPMLAERRNNATIIALSGKDSFVKKSFSNFGNIFTEEVRNLNPVDILGYRYLIIEKPTEAFGVLKERVARSKRA